MKLGEPGVGERVWGDFNAKTLKQERFSENLKSFQKRLSQIKTPVLALVFLLVSSAPAQNQEHNNSVLGNYNIYTGEPHDIFYLHDKYSYIVLREGFEVPERFHEFTVRFWKVLEFFDRYNLTAEDIIISYDIFISWENGDISQERFERMYDFLWASFSLLSQEEFDALMFQAGIIKSNYSLNV